MNKNKPVLANWKKNPVAASTTQFVHLCKYRLNCLTILNRVVITRCNKSD